MTNDQLLQIIADEFEVTIEELRAEPVICITNLFDSVHDEGYEAGYAAGESIGSACGYDNGHDAGYEDGYNDAHEKYATK